MQLDSPHYLAELVRDTLYQRRVDHSCCIVCDPASEELEARGPSALPVIESVVLAEAEGNCPAYDRVRFREFPGLLSVMGVYFQISDRFSLHENAVIFLQRISFGVRLDALDAINRLVYWDKAIPKVLMDALKDLATNVTSEENAIIERIIERHPPRRWWKWAT